jgi:hypothetical protein
MCKSQLCLDSTYTYWTLVQPGLQGACNIFDGSDAAATSCRILHLLEGHHHFHGLMAAGESVLCGSLIEQQLVDSGSKGLRHTTPRLGEYASMAIAT